jgi:hypothetical protein
VARKIQPQRNFKVPTRNVTARWPWRPPLSGRAGATYLGLDNLRSANGSDRTVVAHLRGGGERAQLRPPAPWLLISIRSWYRALTQGDGLELRRLRWLGWLPFLV